MMQNFKQPGNKAEDWYGLRPVDPRVGHERAEHLRSLGFWAHNDVVYDFATHPERLYANDRDFFYMHPLNGWLSKLIDDKRFISIVFRGAPHLVPKLSIGVEDAEPKFVLRNGVPQLFGRELKDVLAQQFEEFPWLFLKPAGLSRGKGSLRFSRESLADAVSQIDSRHAYVVNNCVNNEVYSERINPYGVNTIRAYVFRPKGSSELRLFRVFHRFGTKSGAPADNLSRGGVVAEIDLQSGLLSEAVAPSRDVVRCGTHPESGEPISGVLVPDWKRKLAQIREMLQWLFFLDFGALDIAATSDGMKLLEVNTRPEMRTLQINHPAFLDQEFSEFCKSKGYGL